MGVFAPTVQPVQMNLQTVCRGRTSGHLLLRLCRSESESTTGRVGRRVAVRLWDCTSQSRQARAQSEGKNRLFDSEINLYRLLNDILPFATLSRLGAQCAPGQRKIIRGVGEHSDSLRAACGGCSLDAHYGGCVRLYGSAGADEFTNGVPRSYPRAPSLAALPQFTLAHPTG